MTRQPTPTPADGLALPADATDTHVHVFEPARFGYAAGRSYTPPAATPAALQGAHEPLGIGRVVLVQPSVYGSDNRCLLAALAQLGPHRARGIAVVDLERTAPGELDVLHAAGVRGIRLNFAVRHEADAARLRQQLAQAAAIVRRPGWCVQVHAEPPLWPLLAELLPAFRVPLVLDHFAGLCAGEAVPPPLLALLASGKVHVKLSAFYRASRQAPHHADLRPLARQLIEAHPDRLLWGSDWPHTGGGGSAARDPGRIEAFRVVDLPASLAALCSWCGDQATLRRILVDNPAALYGFGDVDSRHPTRDPQ